MNVHGHMHDKGHRDEEFPFDRTKYHYLLSLERHEYKPWTLEEVIHDYEKAHKETK